MNKKIDWKRKLSSRKFWMAVVGVVSAIATIYKLEDGTTAQITALIMSFATLIAYILSEGFIDAKNIENSKDE